METKPKRAKNLIRLEKDPLVGKWLKGYKAESRKIYRSTLTCS